MNVTLDLDELVTAHVDARFKGLEGAVGLKKFRVPRRGDDFIPDQPDGTEFTTVGRGEGSTASDAVLRAYGNAFESADIACGDNGPPKFKKFVSIEQEGNGKYRVEVVWVC